MRKQSFLFLSLISSSLFASAPKYDVSIDKSGPPKEDPNPRGRFMAVNGVHAFIGAEALLLQLTQDDLPYAVYQNLPGTTGIYNNKVFHYGSNWRWGFKVKAGYHLSHDGWTLEADYMRFYSHYYSAVNQKSGNTLYAQAQLPDALNPDNLVNFKWGVKFNQWDLFQTRNFYVSRFLRLKPLLGLRNLLLGQTYQTTINQPSASYQNKTSTHFWGMGVLAGVHTFWNLNYQFSLYGKVNLSSMFGHYNNRLKDGIYNPGSTIYAKNNSPRASVTGLDLAIGAQWYKYFYNDKLLIAANIGFEQYTYFNLNRNFYGIADFNQYEGLSGRDFSMQGFSFGLKIDF